MKKNKNIYAIFLRKFMKIIIHIWIQQFYFGRKRKYLWKRFYTIKRPLKNRANLSRLGGEAIFSMLDSIGAYHSIPHKIGDRTKAAFSTSYIN